ncbi:MAG: 3-deoxy-D-manno-octulosonic acid transferase [Polaromonas sp.]|uniref:3-deoxy-D-manno-octulosonic acid transferase n=1 Tax=Polaromonas sp. TaxID=1869339 RepID=UPI00272F5B80|nr:3-deoxy-D-manno-octulosonic acid transferase [Polaromonas sp.]MDP2452416.1 3-deoxy-D-manno-octulosonic acid transferase [Polaromonas sp.]MDP3246807.1 3-deoxy-D-manno-octulosonic acid transferase [Polaromonas sp.]
MGAASLMIRQLYSLFMWAAQPFLRRKLRRRGLAEPGYLDAVEERFGHYTQAAESTSDLVWVHAVSLGETRTAGILLAALRARWPGLRILLTHGTATGRAEGAGLLRAGDVQVWQPWDSQAAVARFFTHFKPRLGLLLETEVWPNTVAGAQARGVPLVLVNARLSDKSLQQALRIARLSRPAYAALAAVYAQSESDAQRLRALGAPVQGVFGNLKFDAAPDPAQQALGRQWRQALGRPVLMLASSREGEEDDFLKQITALALSTRAPPAPEKRADGEPVPAAADFQILIVPRHPQRFDEVQALVEKHGLTVSRRSSQADAPATADVWLGDSLGEMALYYAMSDVALLGGSFEALGGQNLIEAAACGCPVIMGPHTFNFAEVAELAEAAGAARRVSDMAEAVRAARAMLSRPSAQQAAAAAGRQFSAQHRGAAANTVQALAPFLKA